MDDFAPGTWSLGLGRGRVCNRKMSESVEPGSAEVGAGPTDAVVRLDEQECWELLAGARFGRLAVAAVRDIDIFPINFAVDGTDLVFRTAEGTKLLASVISGLVAIEADHRDPAAGTAWSVVAKGSPRLLERFDSIYAAQSLGITPWVEDVAKERFVRVSVSRISGRRFRRSEPG
jgi:nitroimidazol reductase NimA-like FMN-containing flavoprotein (pyridoxamine 5'-phosphate oxidase superfamily)